MRAAIVLPLRRRLCAGRVEPAPRLLSTRAPGPQQGRLFRAYGRWQDRPNEEHLRNRWMWALPAASALVRRQPVPSAQRRLVLTISRYRSSSTRCISARGTLRGAAQRLQGKSSLAAAARAAARWTQLGVERDHRSTRPNRSRQRCTPFSKARKRERERESARQSGNSTSVWSGSARTRPRRHQLLRLDAHALQKRTSASRPPDKLPCRPGPRRRPCSPRSPVGRRVDRATRSSSSPRRTVPTEEPSRCVHMPLASPQPCTQRGPEADLTSAPSSPSSRSQDHFNPQAGSSGSVRPLLHILYRTEPPLTSATSRRPFVSRPPPSSNPSRTTPPPPTSFSSSNSRSKTAPSTYRPFIAPSPRLSNLDSRSRSRRGLKPLPPSSPLGTTSSSSSSSPPTRKSTRRSRARSTDSPSSSRTTGAPTSTSTSSPRLHFSSSSTSSPNKQGPRPFRAFTARASPASRP